jgi:hypothetical protein
MLVGAQTGCAWLPAQNFVGSALGMDCALPLAAMAGSDLIGQQQCIRVIREADINGTAPLTALRPSRTKNLGWNLSGRQ